MRIKQMQPTGAAIGRISGCPYRAAPAADLQRSAGSAIACDDVVSLVACA
jgi:AICAR transformylase/IMP cyclohydrolase PurH